MSYNYSTTDKGVPYGSTPTTDYHLGI